MPLKHQVHGFYKRIKHSRKWQTNRLLVILNPLFNLGVTTMIFGYQKIYLPIKRSQPGRAVRTLRAKIWRQAKSLDINSNIIKLARLRARTGKWQASYRLYNLAKTREINSKRPRLELINDAKLNVSVINRIIKIGDYKKHIDQYNKINKKPRIAIYTAISGGYDTIKLPDVLLDNADYFLFTDTPVRETGIFKIRPLPYYHVDTTRRARYVKTHPHQLLSEYDLAIWIDANILINGDITELIKDFVKSKKAVGAIPHPIRNTLFEEVDACIARSKDDVKLIREQAYHYREFGYDTSELIESNIMLFDLKNKKLPGFFATWWSEIDKFTRRDQLSLNYSLDKNGIDWHRIMKRPHDARNHPLFTLVPHLGKQNSVLALEEAIGGKLVDPYAGTTFAETKKAVVKSQSKRKIDIVYCVHNAFEDVKICLTSVAKHRKSPNLNLIVVDDGSDKQTADYLKNYQKKYKDWVQLMRNDKAGGYTKAANKGMRASSGELVIILNSDTIVTDGWSEKMAEAVFSTSGAGIVGPLSSAASHQSIPNHIGGSTQTATNELPDGLTPDEINKHCEEWSVSGLYPHVPLIHGFCIGITRQVFDKIGYFDEKSFPTGYGEENDLCFRAVDAGFCLVVATNTYIFHAKSKSFKDEKRILLMKNGNEKLRELRGKERITRAVKSVLANTYLQKFRDNTFALYKEYDK